MSTAVLLSIKPSFADAIFSGEKHFEFRKVIFRDQNARTVFVYASAPISHVIGVFYIEEILTHSPKALWKITKRGAGISKEYFEEYFSGREVGYAVRVRNPTLFARPKSLSDLFDIDRPPQSFRYVTHPMVGERK